MNLKKINKFGGILNIILSAIYLTGTIVLTVLSGWRSESFLGIILTVFFFSLGLWMIRKARLPESFKKLNQVLAYIIQNSKIPLTEGQVKYLLFLFDYTQSQKNIISFPELPSWEMRSSLEFEAFNLVSHLLNKFNDLKNKGLDITVMIPPEKVSPEEQSVIKNLLETHEGKSEGDLRVIIYDLPPVQAVSRGTINLLPFKPHGEQS